MAKVERKKNESFEAFIRRVKRLWQGEGKMIQVRKIQYFTRKKSKNLVKESAVKRAVKTQRMTYLRKIGKLPPEEEMGRNKRGRR